MFRKYPYWIVLLAGLMAWFAAAWHYSAEQAALKPDHFARKIGEDIRERQKAVDHLLKRHDDVLKRIMNGKPTTKDIALLGKQPFYLYYYYYGTLRFWNNNLVVPKQTLGMYTPAGALTEENGSTYFTRRIDINKGQQFVVFFPVAVVYPFENDYLQSHFAASSLIPPSAIVTPEPLIDGAVPVFCGKQQLGYLNVTPDETPAYQPDGWIIGLSAAGTLLLLIWVQWCCIYLTDKKRFIPATIIVFSVAILLRFILYYWGLPFGIGETHLFSPQLYASSALLPSLADVMINGLMGICIIIFILTRLYFNTWLKRKMNGNQKGILGIIIALFMILAGYSIVRVCISIVLDSNISFDLQHLYALDLDTVCGLVTICILATNILLTTHFCRTLLQNMFPVTWYKYPFILLAGLLLMWMEAKGANGTVCALYLVWMLLTLLVMDTGRVMISADPFTASSLFWTVFFSVSAALLLAWYNHDREHETRKKFAEQLVTRHDDVMEWNFNTIGRNIRQDSMVKDYLQYATPERRNRVNEHLNILYLNSQLNNYQTRIYFFDTTGYGLYNTDTLSFPVLQARISQSLPTPTPDLYYTENAVDDHYYVAHVTIEDVQGYAIGHLFIDMAQKKTASETVFPELLQPARINKAQKDAGYYYAVYANKRLLTQSNDYPFPFYLNDDTGRRDEYEWINYADMSTLTYRNGGKEAIVARIASPWQEVLTLFSYLFGIQLMLALTVFVFRLSGQWGSKSSNRRETINLTLRRRIQLSVLGIVLVSFLIIAATTIAFFRQRYEQNNRKSIQSLTQRIERALQQFLKDEYSKGHDNISTIARTTAFRYFITDLARSQKTDINLFGASGVLLATSQNDIFEKSLLAPVMQPEVFRQLSTGAGLLSIRNERIGKLRYVSSYVPLRREDSRIEGYINIPLFSVQKELDAQIADILVALINLYAFIFLVSSVLAVVTTGWLTRTLNIIIRQFERLNLQQNELLEWPYEDEIGLLVREYNKMVRKVEENAVLLAQSEREGAWREMARQVAHEIKNPLTPMKLNIQYLQNAISSNRADIIPLAQKVSISIIEQIDNLSYIASEFSNFAAMPEARAEAIVLNELLEKVVALHQHKQGVDVHLGMPEEPLTVMADYSQLLRVFTNLLQNAIQAIVADEHRHGHIEVLMQKEEEEVNISIADNGHGISEEIRERIFKPYFTTKSSGTGLGLAMTRKIIELWKGQITFESEVDKGTTFFIRLPLYNEEQ